MKTNEEIKKHMSEDERLKLAEKLDKELDEFIDSLPKSKYEDGWPEDRWEEEMEKHPFFMKNAPEPGQELHPLYEGLQKLKYDPEENEPNELALAYKDDGNFNFKHKKYRLAILAYTEGIKQKCEDPEIEASLLNNRAASHWFLKNYRSCLKDCELALKIKPEYEKALLRSINCCLELKDFQKGIEYCDRILHNKKDDQHVLELRQRCVNMAKLKERDERKKQIEIKKRALKEEKLITEILKRGYNIEGGKDGNVSLSYLEPCFPQLVQNQVFLDENLNCLVWPVIFVYPEYQIMDYIQQFTEKESLQDHLNCVFENYPEWDTRQEYKPDCLNVYFETKEGKIIRVDTERALEDVLKMNGYVIKAGTPSFIVFVKGSSAEKTYLHQ